MTSKIQSKKKNMINKISLIFFIYRKDSAKKMKIKSTYWKKGFSNHIYDKGLKV